MIHGRQQAHIDDKDGETKVVEGRSVFEYVGLLVDDKRKKESCLWLSFLSLYSRTRLDIKCSIP